jgi:peptidoglycan L-alanyl-D-glutamate endopeptidase CwlK|tara:strand:- start:1514 stop:1963 length:450 start_codon:yes stop_codon:yes gene_type:complete
MSFKLSERSLDRLKGVDQKLVDVVKRAIDITEIDFGVTEGLRTLSRQKQLVEKGASQTLKSKHLGGRAVDLAAYVGPRISWELAVYDDVAEAIRQAANELDVTIRWGAAWHKNLTDTEMSAEALMNEYIDLRRSQSRRPFIDAMHFELA